MKNRKQIMGLVTLVALLLVTGFIYVSKHDPECNGDKNEWHDLGYGSTHEYKGTLRVGEEIKMVVSCGLSKITVTAMGT